MVEMHIKGTQVNYYFVCKTKLWLFSHNISMENESDDVKLGKLLHRETFKRDDKEIRVGSIAIDIVKKRDVLEIKEIKKSKKMEKAHVYQTLYYLFYLKKFGINAKASITFPKQREVINLELSEDDEKELEKVVKEINKIVKGEMPKPSYKKSCRRCAYFEFCFC